MFCEDVPRKWDFLLRSLRSRSLLICSLFCYTSAVFFAKKAKLCWKCWFLKYPLVTMKEMYSQYLLSEHYAREANIFFPLLMTNVQHIKSLITCYKCLTFCFAIQLFNQKECCKILRIKIKEEKNITSAHFTRESPVLRQLQMDINSCYRHFWAKRQLNKVLWLCLPGFFLGLMKLSTTRSSKKMHSFSPKSTSRSNSFHARFLVQPGASTEQSSKYSRL